MAVSRESIDRHLDRMVNQLLESENLELHLGWRLFNQIDGRPVPDTGKIIPNPSSDQLQWLVKNSEKNRDAFDMACFFAANSIKSGAGVPLELRDFASQIVLGERVPPARRGRPMATGKILELAKLGLAHLVQKTTDLPMGRNRENSRESRYNACQAVADAFTRAGKHTTFQQVASLVYDKGNEDLRTEARRWGIVDWSHILVPSDRND